MSASILELRPRFVIGRQLVILSPAVRPADDRSRRICGWFSDAEAAQMLFATNPDFLSHFFGFLEGLTPKSSEL
jgi:hypothetical protein